ncbi:MAG: hypothetical protein M0R50_08830 [Candidatus Cloacimonetes bacterium]|jgi:hypothetical protein|nr:hypothetical protein [Candidatus Cloacimonadota bacterium]
MEEQENLPKWFQEHVPTELADSSLFKFKIKLQNGSTIEVNLAADIDINFDILEDQHERIPAQYIYWAAIYSELRCAVAIMELRMKSRRKSITRRITEEFHSTNTKLTDKQLLALTEGDDGLVKNEAELAILQRNCGKVYHMVEAIKLRSEHTRSLAGFKRQEKEQSGRQT